MKKEIKAVLVISGALIIIGILFCLLKFCVAEDTGDTDVGEPTSLPTSASSESIEPSTEVSDTPSIPSQTFPLIPETRPSEPCSTEPVVVVPPELDHVDVLTLPDKLNYFVGDTLDPTGLTLLAVYDNGSSLKVQSGFICSPLKLNVHGTQKVSVLYDGHITSFEVSVKVPEITGISVESLPDRTIYQEGETVDVSGLGLMVSYSDGSKIPVKDGFTTFPTRVSCVEKQIISVVYQGFKTEFEVKVSLDILASGSCGDRLDWKLTHRGTLIISGDGKMEDYSFRYHAPWSDYSEDIRSIFISEDVHSICEWAFAYCSRVRSISVEQGNRSFVSVDGALYTWDQSELLLYPKNVIGQLVLPESVRIIRSFAFTDGMLTEAVISENVVAIGANAFCGCSSLKSVTIGAGVREISVDVFSGCLRLGKLVIESVDCQIPDNPNSLGMSDITIIYGYSGSSAQDYAVKYGYEFVEI